MWRESRLQSRVQRPPILLTIVAVCVIIAPAASAQTTQPWDGYQILAGNTHAHTAFTWSHGDQWAPGKPDPAKKGKPSQIAVSEDGAQKPAAGKVLKDDWKKQQGPPAEHFAHAKAAGYDFYITTDHSQEADFQPPAADNAKWLAAKRAADEATDGRFVAIAGYEHSENNGPGGTGHLNVINSDAYLNAMAPGVDLPKLYAWLKSAAPNGEGPIVASFNHPGPRSYDDWSNRDDAVTDILTLLEVINSNNKIHEAAFIRALDKGWKVSPACGNDNHGFWGITHHTSRTFVLATARTKSAILDAMQHRRTYASLETNLRCGYTVNGAIMGSTLEKPTTFRFDIAASDPDIGQANDRITKIDIVKDGGAIAATWTPDEPSHTVAWRPTIEDATSKYFFVRLYTAAGGDAPKADPHKPVAWLAPVWTGR